MSLLDDLKRTNNISVEQILTHLMESDKNIGLKTQIEAPLELTVLKVIATMCENNKLNKSALALNTFIENYQIYMVSYKREGRKEIIDALKGLVEREKRSLSTTEKLFGAKNE